MKERKVTKLGYDNLLKTGQIDRFTRYIVFSNDKKTILFEAIGAIKIGYEEEDPNLEVLFVKIILKEDQTISEWINENKVNEKTRYTFFDFEGNIVGEFIGDKQVEQAEPEIPENLTKITYQDLVTLKTNEELSPGAFYRITDYETTTVQFNTQSAEHLFDIVIQALSESELAEVGTAIEREGEDYFANAGSKLGAWQIWYDINNDRNKYHWADNAYGKGVIYRMIDEHMNDLPYDFKNIQFKRYKVIDDTKNGVFNGTYFGAKTIMENVVSEFSIDEYNSIWAYTFTVRDENGISRDNSVITFPENGPEFGGTIFFAHDNIIGIAGKDFETSPTVLVWAQILPNTVFMYDRGSDDYWESFASFFYNTFGKNCVDNTIGANATFNTVGSLFRGNTIGNYFETNKIGLNFMLNTISNNFAINTINAFFANNVIGDGFVYNNIGIEFTDNIIAADFQNNIADNHVQFISFSVDGMWENEIKNLHLKNELRGDPNYGKLDLYFSGLYGRAYNTTFEIIADGKVVASWSDSPLSLIGKKKDSKTSASWDDIV